MINATQAIINSLKETSLLVDNLNEVSIFNRQLLSNFKQTNSLNFDQKLGHLYEDALEALIRNSSLLDLLASHVQIFDNDKKTIGELDFIVFDQIKQQHIHLELAVKFYLGIETKEGWQYPGPDQRDNWYKKLKRLQSHQLILSQNPEAKLYLKEAFDIIEIMPQQLIYGCLFRPFNTKNMPNPKGVSTNGRRGQWLYIDQWEEAFNNVRQVFHVPKHLWPVEITKDTRPLFEKIEVEALKELAQERCVMFALEEGVEPWFLAPNEWGNKI